jgi:helix-turn-helix protein
MNEELLQLLCLRLTRIEERLQDLVESKQQKDFYSTQEVAESLGKAEFTVREWCRLGRIHATKRATGRGRSQEWMVSHQELTRVRNEGLLPQPKYQPRY